MNTQITFVQAGMIFTLSIGLMNHVIVIPLLLDAAGRDAWISVILSFALYILWILIFYYIHKKTKKENLIIWIRTRYGSILARLFIGLIVVYVFCLSTITLKDTMTWITMSFLPGSSIVVNSVIFSLLCLINAYFGITSIAMTSGILLPFVVILGFFVMSFNSQHKDFLYLMPYLEHGMKPVFDGMLYVSAGFVELILLLFIQHHLRQSIRLLPLCLLGLVFTGLTLGPLIGAIVEFGPEQAANLRYPAYEEWRLLRIGSYIEHMDFFSIYQWFTGAFIRISLTVFIIADLLGGMMNRRKRLGVLSTFFVLILAATFLPIGDIKFYGMLYHFLPYLLGVVMTIFAAIFILVLLGFRERSSST